MATTIAERSALLNDASAACIAAACTAAFLSFDASDENGYGMGWSGHSSDAGSGFGMGPSFDASRSWPLPSGENGLGSDASCSWPLPWP